jgi:hypothetical protein
MNEEEFLEMLAEIESDEHEILYTKGIEYSQGNRTDRLANFYKIAQETGSNPKAILWVFMRKHLDSIANYIKSGKEFSDETIESRIHDARNYLALLYCIIQEEKHAK